MDIKNRPLKRVHIYEDMFYSIMQWGSNARWAGKIPHPPNNKNNFPYYLEKFIEVKSDKQKRSIGND